MRISDWSSDVCSSDLVRAIDAEWRNRLADRELTADKSSRGIEILRRRQLKERVKLRCLLDRLFHLAVAHKLLRELTGVHRVERVLMLQLGCEQIQEHIEVCCEFSSGRSRCSRIEIGRAHV